MTFIVINKPWKSKITEEFTAISDLHTCVFGFPLQDTPSSREMIALSLLLFAGAFEMSIAFPNGAPNEICESMLPKESIHGIPQQSPSPYKISCRQDEQKPFRIVSECRITWSVISENQMYRMLSASDEVGLYCVIEIGFHSVSIFHHTVWWRSLSKTRWRAVS